ncbi:hypothetical protein V6B33_21525 [Mangrovibacillus sp. Mu-81]|jgi:hypothetical protein|uniref:hypothetical protein n=1 Tax=Mangrovibacillus sp. Mu-81 TaxID=3121478 RepID=UPI002FE4F16F
MTEVKPAKKAKNAFVADSPYGTRLFAKPYRFSDRSLRLALQSTARTSYIQNGHLNKANKNPNLLELKVQISSGFIQTKTLWSQPLSFL